MEARIAILHYSCPPVVGGVEEMIRRQAKVLKEHFHNVKVFAGDGDKFLEGCEVEINPLLSSTNAEVVKANEEARKGGRRNLEKLAERICNYLEETLADFDVLIAHNVLSMHFNLALTYALHRLADKEIIPIIAWNHDSPYFYEDYPRYLDTEPWSILKEANPNIHYVTISEYRKKLFQKLYRKNVRIEVISDGIDPKDFLKMSPLSVKVIEEMDLLKKDLLIFQPCRLHPRKNVELSIKVLRSLKEKNLNVSLIITGAHDPHDERSRDYKRRLIELASKEGVGKDIVFLAGYKLKDGSVLHADLISTMDFYLISDLLFLPSLHEGFGIPLLEAGLLRVPVLCSDIDSFKEIGKRDVEMFSLKDPPEKIAERIVELVNRSKQGRLFRRILKEYSLESIYIKKFLPLLKNVLKGQK
ncbi:MAG: glycosyl transferase family 1 [Thermoplasmata archaeon]|nr:MAG: glycosyl transferase family 1 [Thermoplasmata archaeon]